MHRQVSVWKEMIRTVHPLVECTNVCSNIQKLFNYFVLILDKFFLFGQVYIV